MALIIIVSTVSFGAMFEARKWAFMTEVLRLLTVPLALLYFFPEIQDQILILTALAAYSVGSLIWVSVLRKSIIHPVSLKA